MNIFRSLRKRDIVTNCLKRNLHGTPKLFDSDCTREPMEIKHPFYLEPIVSENHTIKDHDNERRQTLYEFGIYVAACMPKYVQKVQIQHNDELEILVCPDGLFPVLSFMCHHQHACFNALSAETAMDVPSRPYRFEVSYNLLSLRFGERARIKTYTDELTPLHSGFPLYQVCHTFEREIYDMYGIIFTHHPDLRRILTDYGFSGHPLRKDFPLVGYTEVRYDDSLKKLVYEPVEFAQEMRKYAVNSPWNYSKNFHEGFNNALPKKETE